MRTPYRTVKGNHPWGGVPQEEYDRVVAELEKKTQEYNAKSALVSGITIEPFTVLWWWCLSNVLWYVSRTESNQNYCFAIYKTESCSGYDLYLSASWSRKGTWNFTHTSSDSGQTYWWYVYSLYMDSWFYKNGTTIMCFARFRYNWSSANDRIYKVTRNYKTSNRPVMTIISAEQEVVPEWYTEITWNEWVQSIGIKNDRATYATITLK